MKESRVSLVGVLSRDERAKLLALGGLAWISLKLRDEPMPAGNRPLHMLTEAERALVLDHRLPPLDVASQLNIKPTAIYQLRHRARRARA